MKRRIAVLLLFLIIISAVITSCDKPAQTDAETTAEEITTAAETTEETEQTTAAETDKTTEAEPVTDIAAESEQATKTETEKETEAEQTTGAVSETDSEQTTEKDTQAETEKEEATKEEPADKETTVDLVLPEKNTDLSLDLAKKLLTFCYGYTETSAAALLKGAGFEIVFAKNYDKAASDRSHTCAYTVAKGKYNGKSIYAVLIRGTMGGEWYSNIDFAPSHDNNTKYAENFYMAAHDIYLSVKDLFDSDPDSYKVIFGHSRGAAASNLLGVTLDNVYNKNQVYVYTFATPNTIRGQEAELNNGAGDRYQNIFNFINPADIVAYVPLEAHGFRRAGTDIMLASEEKKSAIITGVESLISIAPDIKSYYEDKHSLTKKGLSDDGMSAYEILEYIAAMYAADKKNMDISKLLTMSPESDLYSALSVLIEFSTSQKMLNIANQHAVSTYAELISAYQKS